MILERGEGRQRGRENSKQERNTEQLPLVHASRGTKPATRTRALTRNQTHSLLVDRMTRQPSEPHWPGLISFLILLFPLTFTSSHPIKFPTSFYVVYYHVISIHLNHIISSSKALILLKNVKKFSATRKHLFSPCSK